MALIVGQILRSAEAITRPHDIIFVEKWIKGQNFSSVRWTSGLQFSILFEIILIPTDFNQTLSRCFNFIRRN